MMARDDIPATTGRLPDEAIRMLTDAARVKNTLAKPMARQIAIERATALVRKRWPECFRRED